MPLLSRNQVTAKFSQDNWKKPRLNPLLVSRNSPQLFELFCMNAEPFAACGRGRYANTHSPTNTCTVGYRNVSDMCNFLVVWGPRVTLCLDWLTEVSQGAAAELLYSIPSLITKWQYTYYKWLYYTQGRVTKCLQGTLAAHSLRFPISLSYQHLLLIFFPSTFLHLVAFAEQNTDYYSIFIIISWGAEAELFGASDSEDPSRYILSRLGDGRCVCLCVWVCACKDCQRCDDYISYRGH